jgi:hypothetical protein
MKNEHKSTADVQALERHLEIYGADQARWPQAARVRFAPLLADDARARALLSEAAALDRLLEYAPVPRVCKERALRDRIVAVISNEGDAARTDRSGARSTDLPRRRQLSWTSPARGWARWQAAALLAASLAIGVYLGSAGELTSEVELVAEAVGLETRADPYQLSLLDDNGTLAGEDLL